jgi:MerR family transcriptional regulator, light-induced transcriptional regulator
MDDGGVLRIGELSKRSGVSPGLLRAWERRYGLLRPTRSAGGLRLYSAADVERVRRMNQHLADGLAAAEAAALAQSADHEPAAQAIFDRLLAAATVDTLLSDVVLPYLRELGERWARGEASIAQEHFASAVLRGRLLGLARGWGLGVGPLAVLACLPGEQHDLGLIAFGLVLRARGWRIVYLGPDAPIDTIEDTCHQLQPSIVVLHAITDHHLQHAAESLRALARHHRVALGGAAATPGAPIPDGVQLLTGDLTAEATQLTTRAQDTQ